MLDLKKKIELCGFKQKIHIKSKDESLPVLIFLHGGPGVISRHGVLKNDNELLDHFTLVCWDQRGSGGSYWGVDPKTLTIDQLTRDAAALVDWCCTTFHKDKVFVIGGSWGSLLGTMLVYRFPDKIAGYVGFGQMVNGPKNEEISYHFALSEAKKHNDTKAVQALEKLGAPVNGNYSGGRKGMLVQRKVMMKYGGYSQDQKKRDYTTSFIIPIIKSGEYSISDLLGLAFGHILVLDTMLPEVVGSNLSKEVGEIKVPYYIYDGRLDYNTPAQLVEDYYNNLKAKNKKLVWFEKSGHNPMGDEPQAFKALLIKDLTALCEEYRQKGVRV